MSIHMEEVRDRWAACNYYEAKSLQELVWLSRKSVKSSVAVISMINLMEGRKVREENKAADKDV